MSTNRHPPYPSAIWDKDRFPLPPPINALVESPDAPGLLSDNPAISQLRPSASTLLATAFPLFCRRETSIEGRLV
jgi:hypothetical protein